MITAATLAQAPAVVARVSKVRRDRPSRVMTAVVGSAEEG
jgi:hypothetical protein